MNRSYLRKKMYKGFRRLIALLDIIVPKNKYLIICASADGIVYRGNARYFFEYMNKNKRKFPPYQVYYYLNTNKKIPFNEMKLTFDLKGIITFLRAKYIIGTHSTTDFVPMGFSFRKIFIHTWHGTPLKRICLAEKRWDKFSEKRRKKKEKRHNWGNKARYFLSQSEIITSVLCRCFNKTDKSILMTGLPRNDHLINPAKSNILIRLLGKKVKNKKIILYAPTFREWKETELFPFKDMDYEKLDNFLGENNLIILMRTHYSEKGKNKLAHKKNILPFSSRIFEEANEVLPEVDILITDYSGIYLDYLLLDRPIFFFDYDLDEYEKERGFMYNDIDFWMPGPHIRSLKEFFVELKKEDKYSQQRNRINKLINTHQTEDSCSKIINFLKNQ
jgi:CDP-glycerol glycerophosphotransferase (TagB/SpsB family)